MNNIFKKFAKKSAAEMRRELARAHLIIALLSMALISMLSLCATQAVQLDPVLSGICVILLLVVAIVSLLTSVTLFKNKK